MILRVHIHEESRNGLAAWCSIKAAYWPTAPGNSEVEAIPLNQAGVRESPESKLEDRIADYDLLVHQWEKKFGLVYNESNKRSSLLAFCPLEERGGVCRQKVLAGMRAVLPLSYEECRE